MDPPEAEDDAGIHEASKPDPEPATPADPELLALIDWVLDALNAGRTPASAELRQHFSSSFLTEVPEAELTAAFAQLSAELRPIVRGERMVVGLSAVVQLDTGNGPWLLEIQVTAATPRKIDSLFLRPAPAAASSYEEVVEMLQPLAAHTQLLVARVSSDGQCSPIHQHAPAERLAIGSAFKLWVLLALSQHLEEDSSVDWTTRLPIRDALKSLPSGVLQNQPNGTLLTLDEYASKMIEISDNTATDHLIDFIGRTAVEAAQTAARHGSPEANIPWLMTRELFVLKLVASDSERNAYRAASVPERRALLEGYRSLPVSLADAEGWTDPRALDLEWFATPLDLCHVLGTLGTRASFSPSSQPLQILALNPGIAFDATRWTYAGYKGGSEPGVLNLSWLLQRSDGAWFSVVLTLNDSESPVDATAAVRVALALMPVVAAEGSP